MGKIKKYAVILYASVVLGLGTAGYAGYELIKDKTFDKKTLPITIAGAATTGLWAFGNIMADRDKKKSLEKKLI